jgi:Mrp family chromosome partitioning ATPase
MARYVSSILLVVSAGTVTRRQVRTAVERLSIIGVDITAVIVNNSKIRRRASYYRYLRPQEKA